MAKFKRTKLSKVQKREVKQMIESEVVPEVKNSVLEVTLSTVSSSATIAPVTTTIQQGSSAIQRVGNEIKLVDFTFSM